MVHACNRSYLVPLKSGVLCVFLENSLFYVRGSLHDLKITLSGHNLQTGFNRMREKELASLDSC